MFVQAGKEHNKYSLTENIEASVCTLIMLIQSQLAPNYSSFNHLCLIGFLIQRKNAI